MPQRLCKRGRGHTCAKIGDGRVHCHYCQQSCVTFGKRSPQRPFIHDPRFETCKLNRKPKALASIKLFQVHFDSCYSGVHLFRALGAYRTQYVQLLQRMIAPGPQGNIWGQNCYSDPRKKACARIFVQTWGTMFSRYENHTPRSCSEKLVASKLNLRPPNFGAQNHTC